MKKIVGGLLLGVSVALAGGAWAGDGKFEYVVFGMGGARWDGGVMKWSYNHQGAPSTISESDALAVLQKAAAKWSNGCNFQFQYQGTTTAATWVKDGTNVLGWQSGFSEAGTTDSRYTDLRLSESDIRFNADSVTSTKSLEAVATHEFGHAMGLDHSNQPDSIMYANPYHSTQDQLTLKNDDITACQALYGASSLGSVSKYGISTQVSLSTGEKVDIYVTATAPSLSSPPTVSLANVSSANGTLYFAGFFSGLTAGQSLRLDLVAPDGTLYDSSSSTNKGSGGYFGFSYNWSSVGASALPGTWQLFLWAGNTLKAKAQFTNTSTYDQPQPPEMVVIGKPSGGNFGYSALNLTPSRAVQQAVWSFDNGALNTASTPQVNFSAGKVHTVQFALRGTQGRYSNQSAGADYLLVQSVPVAADGSLGPVGFSGQASGSKESTTLQATVVIPSSESGTKNVYVVAQVGSSLFYKTAGTWSALQSGIQPLFSTVVPAVATFNVLDAMDISVLPPGTAIYAGYGDSLEQVLQKSTYGKVFTAP